MENQKDPIGYILITIFFILLAYAGWLSAKSIDWDVLKRMEQAPLTLPSSVATQSATTITPSNSKK